MGGDLRFFHSLGASIRGREMHNMHTLMSIGVKDLCSLWLRVVRRCWFLPHTLKLAQVGHGASIGRKAWIEGYARIVVGDHAVISDFCHLKADTGASIVIGKRSRIEPYALIQTFGGFVSIGDDCTVNPYCVLYGHGGLEIGNDVHIATQVVVIPANHIFEDPGRPISQQGETASGICIEDDVWIGAGVRILDGVRIGRGSVIGAGAVMTRDVAPFSVAVGVPARVVNKRSAEN
jgi:acetyltransferase-like isoleucine patch superfamily enzyme